ncbi:FAD-dependent oxidoreductase [Herbaspirillum sp. RTI4]|uniref:FAD-dependent oxidoreductase n=1 Tax=Herbaspirillum sp. RTI4 TaxID=3048640 RepID=UPI002AB4E5D8|nr:FAD-dependent oxidoreductase [Herbaspirillum sp. RTI4]MDY7577614.1 FAD-dependent oxidoreductase [Herbaspirillum sp. RTI4]MEA9983285.1 FAD-dependent oxidoreductase [Herbaspirillum sp. RTI4]
MMEDFDVIIVGSGPAGVSAAFPLVAAGWKVLMVDGGEVPSGKLPQQSFLEARTSDPEQWKWMVGENFHALSMREAVSPKMRVASHSHVFSGFNQHNRINAENFISVGSLAPGGLSNAWGCGVAKFSSAELDQFPFPSTALDIAYQSVAKRMGISGPRGDDLSDYFGLDSCSQAAIDMDPMHQSMFGKYGANRVYLHKLGVRFGRSRLAALSADHNGRQGCNLSGNCLYGCDRGALYSATDDLRALKKFTNFHHLALVVDGIRKNADGWSIDGQFEQVGKTFSASKILLAAGTIASTRLALKTLDLQNPVRLLSCPTAAFVLCLPSFFGAARTPAFGFGQISFVLSLREDVSALGATFATSGLPLSEFARYMPLRRRYGIDLLKSLLSSCVVGNLFLPGHLSDNQARLDQDGVLQIKGGYHHETDDLLTTAHARLRKAYRRLGAYMLPTSFTAGKPGGDIHYAGTLPMRKNPIPGESDASGQLFGLAGVYVVDGACLPVLPEKSHTLTIMANAHRIACEMVTGA